MRHDANFMISVVLCLIALVLILFGTWKLDMVVMYAGVFLGIAACVLLANSQQ